MINHHKMTTREKILQAALELYNEQGSDTITIRHIAAKVGISHGNLGYHFPATKDIVRELFLQMIKELNERMAGGVTPPAVFSPAMIYQTALSVFSILDKYRFILLDFASITRKDKFIRDTYRTVMAKRKEQLFFLFHSLQSAGIMRTDIPEIVFERLIKAILIISNAWLANHAVLEDTLDQGQAERYAKVVFSLYIPYLTEKGMEMFKEFIPL